MIDIFLALSSLMVAAKNFKRHSYFGATFAPSPKTTVRSTVTTNPRPKSGKSHARRLLPLSTSAGRVLGAIRLSMAVWAVTTLQNSSLARYKRCTERDPTSSSLLVPA